ncbi:MAG: hypothetical protein DMG89_11485 [Acidobacteria bacterium]|nr:MAG: hypothetical protein DMG89_11485 [Acidobacteriota bacterium]
MIDYHYRWRSADNAPTKKVFAVHPGEILKTEFMEPMGVTAYVLAKELNFPGNLCSCAKRVCHQRRIKWQMISSRLVDLIGTTKTVKADAEVRS